MITFGLRFSNPWFQNYFKNLGCLHGKISRYWSWELEHLYHSQTLLELDFNLTTKHDHAGFNVVAGILGYSIGFRVYDKRHWDHEKDDWQRYDQDY